MDDMNYFVKTTESFDNWLIHLKDKRAKAKINTRLQRNVGKTFYTLTFKKGFCVFTTEVGNHDGILTLIVNNVKRYCILVIHKFCG